jgi:outer membrane cobalamin receptor
MRSFWILALGMLPLFGQRGTGELRLLVTDVAGGAVSASGLLVNQATQVRKEFVTDASGHYLARNLPFGAYRLRVEKEDFGTYSTLVEIRSEIPLIVKVALNIAPVSTEIVVRDSETLIDPHRTGTPYFIGADTLQHRKSAAPGRSVLELVDSEPGFLLEANGILHPRGSEYDVQYVVDGIPITDNRSPAFAPEIDVDDVRQMKVMTSSYPAEYGRKLGGVVELTMDRDLRPGFHGKAVASGGSFSTAAGYLLGQYSTGRSTFALSAQGARTDRYLDPPVEQNFTNKGASEGITARFDTDVTEQDRFGLNVHRIRTAFLVPNELIQESAGQRQDRNNEETMGQVSYQKILSPSLLVNVRAMARDLSAGLWSNPLSTPISAAQQRGFRETYVNGSVSTHLGSHEIKAGTEAIFTSLSEQFSYNIATYELNGQPVFDPGTPASFHFADRRQDREQSLFVQDLLRAGRFTFSAGIRWDHYRLLVDESGWSPRLGMAWTAPSIGLVLHASYDRVFETPPIENLLLSSSVAARSLNDNAIFLPVRPSRGNFYEVGFTKGLFNRVRLTGNYFVRDSKNFLDDSLLLNTGVNFPIEFRGANIHGFESKLDLPRWGPFSGFLSYSNLVGKARLPVGGGLFLGNDAVQAINSSGTLPITQDQRNTARARVRTQLRSRAWIAFSASYASGLPIEGIDTASLGEQYGSRILNRLNIERGRVRPSFSVDASVGVDLWKHESKAVRIQADVLNITNRLNVINFAGLFSGTAIGPPRSFALRLQTAW